MSVSNLATGLIVTFVVFIVVIASQFVYVNWRRRSFRRHTSHPPPIPPLPIIRSGNQTPDFSIDDVATKELLYFFCLKPAHELSPNKNTDGSSPEDQVVDVFKLLEANGRPARFLCTIKEEDKEDVESRSEVDFLKKQEMEDVCLPSCLQLAEEPVVVVVVAEEEEVGVTVDGGDGDMKTEFSTPCDSPFFTPVGSPSRDFTETKVAVSVHITGNVNDR